MVHVVISLEDKYLKAEARARGVSKTMLVRLVMEKIIADELIPSIIGTEPIQIPPCARYRRFKPIDKVVT